MSAQTAQTAQDARCWAFAGLHGLRVLFTQMGGLWAFLCGRHCRRLDFAAQVARLHGLQHTAQNLQAQPVTVATNATRV